MFEKDALREQFVEIRVEYDVSVALIFEMGNGTVNLDTKHMAPYVAQFRFGDPAAAYTPEQGQIVKTTFVYDMAEVGKMEEKKKAEGVRPIEPWWAVLAAIIVMAVLYLIWYYWKKRRFPLIHRFIKSKA